MSPELAAAIEHLYAIFKRYELAAHVLGCPCCVTDEDDARLHSRPLRSLIADDLSDFAFSAMLTWGTADDFRHLLPRILELVAIDGGGHWIDPQVVFGKLPYGNWRRWPLDEQLAIERYLIALCSEASRTPDHPLDLDDCLCSIALAVDDLTPFLALWRPDRSAGEASQFANWAWNATWGKLTNDSGPWRMRGSWWDERPVQAGQVASWVLMPERVSELETAFFSFEFNAEATTAIS